MRCGGEFGHGWPTERAAIPDSERPSSEGKVKKSTSVIDSRNNQLPHDPTDDPERQLASLRRYRHIGRLDKEPA